MGIYRRVTFEDRIQLKAYLSAGLSQSHIAVKLGFSKSTISREISRNRGQRGYRFQQAHELSQARQRWRSNPRKMDSSMIKVINSLLARKWSPEQISRRLELEGQRSVSHETIYQHVYRDFRCGGRLFVHLRFSHRKRKPRFPRKNIDRRGVIQNAVSIEHRSAGGNNRSRYGHWERDTMFGEDRRNSVLVLADRKSRYLRLGKLSRRTSSLTLKKTKELLANMPMRSMTNDRGREFMDHQQLTKELKIPVFFCHPYSSSERGTVENRIGILRQYLAKGSNLKYLKHSTLHRIETERNSPGTLNQD